MLSELIFTDCVLFFLVIVLAMGLEHFIAVHFLENDSFILKVVKRFDKKHPGLCDEKDDFYCFFKKKIFHMR